MASLQKDHNIPVISIAINGGYTALDIIANCTLYTPIIIIVILISVIAMQQDFSTIVVEGTGRACDAVSQLVRVAKKQNMSPETASLDKILSIAVDGKLSSIICFYSFYF